MNNTTEKTAVKSSRPWRISEGQIFNVRGEAIASVPYALGDSEDEANGRMIVRAVNSHEALLAACGKALEILELVGPMNTVAANKVRAAIALAEAGE